MGDVFLKACGLVVEYNPLHNGHVYHIQSAQKVSQADCIIAVMSGPFLQRGEPAIIDKFYRAKAALVSGVDIVLELPYPYAVQSSQNFAKGAVRTLDEIGVYSICFGIESGKNADFTTAYQLFKKKEPLYTEAIQHHLKLGISFPEASMLSLEKVGLTATEMDLSQPNNMLGFSYVRTILDHHLPIEPLTIKREQSHYHDQLITNSIASATSIRKQLIATGHLSEQVKATLPTESITQLTQYQNVAPLWHKWEDYFPFIHYRVMTMSNEELAHIQGVDEGLEYRIKEMAKNATSFHQWMNKIKTKRYTWTRLQRIFVHILTNTKKTDLVTFEKDDSVPYIRLLGFTNTGRTYLNQYKKKLNVPLFTQFSKKDYDLLKIDERASHAYYSIIPPAHRKTLQQQEIGPPIFIRR